MSERTAAVVVAVGSDRPGLANSVAHRVKEADCTFEDARMETLGSYFAMMMRISGAPSNVERLRERLPGWGREQGLDVSTFDDLREPGPRPGESRFSLRVDAIERKGIVDRLTRALCDCDVNVARLDAGIVHSAFSGELRFILEALVEVQEPRLPELWDALDETGLDYVLIPVTDVRADGAPAFAARGA